MSDLISRQAAIDALDGELEITGRTNAEAVKGYIKLVKDRLERLSSVQSVNYGSTNLIDKNKVLDAIHNVIFSIIDTSPLTVIDKQLLSINKAITTKIKELPSAQPERKKGKWEVCNILDYAQRPTGRRVGRCSHCGHLTDEFQTIVESSKKLTNFCPNCGAQMDSGKAEYGETYCGVDMRVSGD